MNMTFNRDGLTDEQLLGLYMAILKPRLIEEKMLILLRQGKISKWFSGIGQEAIAVGVAKALMPEETIFTMHRNLGVFTTRDVPFKRLFSQWQGKGQGFTKGRDRSFHFGTMDYNIVGMISHLGPQLSLADGVGLAHKISDEKAVTAAFTGEGGTSQGEFHEALNVASVWSLPVLFIIENNGYGLSTPTSEQYNCAQLADRGKGYGMEAITIDGNNILEVYNTIKQLAKDMREQPRPVLIECMTFRMRGHEEASGTKYVPDELMAAWAEKDPLNNYEAFLKGIGLLDEDKIKSYRDTLKKEINADLEDIYDEKEVKPDIDKEMADVYAPHHYEAIEPATDNKKDMRFVDALSDGLRQSMERHDKLVLMGQDIAEYGGVFKVTDGFLEKFGRDRVRNTPLCESAIVGAALGLGLKGYKSMVEMQFADFVTCGFNQIINNLAKLHYRWGHPADVVIRMPTGGGVGAGPYHSQTNEAWFAHTPGLKVVYPSNPIDAKGLLMAAFDDPNPIMYFEHKALYRSDTASVSIDPYTVEIGKAAVARVGTELSIITYGLGVKWAIETVKVMDIDAEIVDLRTLLPLDYEAIAASVKKCSKVLVLHEDTLFGGLGGEISAYISEHLFEYLDGPVMRCGSLDTPVPFAKPLEAQFQAKQRLQTTIERLLSY